MISVSKKKLQFMRLKKNLSPYVYEFFLLKSALLQSTVEKLTFFIDNEGHKKPNIFFKFFALFRKFRVKNLMLLILGKSLITLCMW